MYSGLLFVSFLQKFSKGKVNLVKAKTLKTKHFLNLRIISSIQVFIQRNTTRRFYIIYIKISLKKKKQINSVFKLVYIIVVYQYISED